MDTDTILLIVVSISVVICGLICVLYGLYSNCIKVNNRNRIYLNIEEVP